MKKKLIIILFIFCISFLFPEGQNFLFSFIIMADTHLSETKYKPIDKFEIAMEKINEINPDFVLILGDIIFPKENTEEERNVKNILSKFKIPIYIVYGNNDFYSKNRLKAIFPLMEKSDYYCFLHKNCLFIGLCDAINDHVGHIESEYITPGQLDWLEKTISENYKKVHHIFIFAHIPLSMSGKAERMYLSTNDQKFMIELILKYKPTALFFGHIHNRMEFKIGKTEIIILPSLSINQEDYPVGVLKVDVFKEKIQKEYIKFGKKDEN